MSLGALFCSFSFIVRPNSKCLYFPAALLLTLWGPFLCTLCSTGLSEIWLSCSRELVVRLLSHILCRKGEGMEQKCTSDLKPEKGQVNKVGMGKTRPSQTGSSGNKDQVDGLVVNGSWTWTWTITCSPRQGELSYLLPSTLCFLFITGMWLGPSTLNPLFC